MRKLRQEVSIIFTLLPGDNTIIELFKPFFTSRIWSSVRLLLMEAILAPGQRTVTAILRIVGLSQEVHFHYYHCVLNRAVWSSLELSQALLLALLTVFVPRGVVLALLRDQVFLRNNRRNNNVMQDV